MTTEIATLGGGCFWCTEAVFLDLRGVTRVVSGYAGGHVDTPTYRQVCSGTTGHAEVVQVTFDPDQLAYEDLLRVFFTIHDPTTLNRQGNDVGTQYRSVIFVHDATQHEVAQRVLAEVAAAGLWPDPPVTTIEPEARFYPAEAEHEDYFARNPWSGYCRAVVAPKVAKFRKTFADRVRRPPPEAARMAFGLAGIIGWPAEHSRSPVLHGHWLRAHGIDGAFVKLAVQPGALEAALRGLAALGFRGASVTAPHKEAAARLVDRLSPEAARIGAVNLVTVAADGSLDGANTDGFGFLASLREEEPAWRPESGPAVVLGAGGAARAIIAALAGAPELRLLNRTAARAQALAAELGGTVTDWERRAEALDGAALLVNTTTQGMAGQPALDLDLSHLPPSALVCDIVYIPRETPLLAAARARGNRVVPGLGMLLHQGRPAFEAWFGVMPAVTAALRAEMEATIA